MVYIIGYSLTNYFHVYFQPCRCRHPRCKQCRLSNIKKATVKVSKRRVPNKKKVDSKELAFRGSRNFFVKAKSLTKKDERFIYQHNCFMVKHQRLGVSTTGMIFFTALCYNNDRLYIGILVIRV